MGTQQILMIILSVIVVGTAIAVGIQMFDTQLENQTRQALAAELIQQAAQAQAWYRTPVMMGGGGNGWRPQPAGPPIGEVPTAIKIAEYIQKSAVLSGTNATYRNLHGAFTLRLEDVEGDNTTKGDATVFITAVSDVNEAIGAECEFVLSSSGGQVEVRQITNP